MKVVLSIWQALYPSLRRRVFYYFRREVMERSLAARQGSCEGCGGQCCLRTRRCPFLRDGLCSRYDEGIFTFCKIFPIDPQDIELSGVADVCRYYWLDRDGCRLPPSSQEKESP